MCGHLGDYVYYRGFYIKFQEILNLIVGVTVDLLGITSGVHELAHLSPGVAAC